MHENLYLESNARAAYTQYKTSFPSSFFPPQVVLIKEVKYRDETVSSFELFPDNWPIVVRFTDIIFLCDIDIMNIELNRFNIVLSITR